MRTQLELIPSARRTDPVTSHEAAEEMNESGARRSQVQEVAEWVVRMPGKTSAELAVLSSLDRYRVARRLPDAEKLGLVVKAGIRICSVSGRRAVTWAPK